jgi:hypothetical protein
MRTQTTALSGGAQRVSLKSLAITTKDGQTISMSIDGDCVSESAGGKSQKFCAQDIEKVVEGLAAMGSGSSYSGQKPPTMTAAQKQAFEDLFRGLMKIGIVTSQSGGKWYVNPVRTYGDLGNTVTSQMKDDDLLQIIGFFKRLGG